ALVSFDVVGPAHPTAEQLATQPGGFIKDHVHGHRVLVPDVLAVLDDRADAVKGAFFPGDVLVLNASLGLPVLVPPPAVIATDHDAGARRGQVDGNGRLVVGEQGAEVGRGGISAHVAQVGARSHAHLDPLAGVVGATLGDKGIDVNIVADHVGVPLVATGAD